MKTSASQAAEPMTEQQRKQLYASLFERVNHVGSRAAEAALVEFKDEICKHGIESACRWSLCEVLTWEHKSRELKIAAEILLRLARGEETPEGAMVILQARVGGIKNELLRQRPWERNSSSELSNLMASYEATGKSRAAEEMVLVLGILRAAIENQS